MEEVLMANVSRPALERLHQAMQSGDIDELRRCVLSLPPEDQALLEARLGRRAVERIYQQVRRKRATILGRVVVVHGILGGRLRSHEEGVSDGDRIWLNYWRILNGRMQELKLDAAGQPADPRFTIEVDGILPDYYLPLVIELGNRWQVLPFSYDWRIDINKSADRLAQQIREWAKGEPTHIVAHSMGGLVSRRFIQRHQDVWAGMRDPHGLASGGRLVMLGTPNRGSLDITQVATGVSSTVRMLERLDFKHDMPGLLDIIDTFIGAFQMLPSPKLAIGDDRMKLFERANWGALPVTQQILNIAKSFQEVIDPVVDGERMRYVAGYNQETLFRIRVEQPGNFTYQTTLDGDGRVPHESGLLPGVRTFWVEEVHGDLPKNEAILTGIHELLRTGATSDLEEQRPAARGAARGGRWEKADRLARVPDEFDRIVGSTQRGRQGERRELDPTEEARAEALILREYLGGAEADETGKPPRQTGLAAPGRSVLRPAQVPKLKMEVVWGDITRTKADVYAVGHYEGILPQKAELALDRAISGTDETDRLIITALARRGQLRGSLGDVDFYPWTRKGGKGRIVAVAGMGRSGYFGRTALRRLGLSLASAVASLPNVRTVASVLIGSGEGNLKPPDALEALLLGLGDALAIEKLNSRVSKLMIVELEYGKACRIEASLRRLIARPDIAERIKIDLATLRAGDGGKIATEDGLALALSAALSAGRAAASHRSSKALKILLKNLPAEGQFRAAALDALKTDKIQRTGDGVASISGIDIRLESATEGSKTVPTRMSFTYNGRNISAAALTDTAVIPERLIGVDFALVNEAISRMVDPPAVSVPMLSSLLARLIVPRDFREKLAEPSPVIFEVDRTMAAVHWEMLATVLEQDGDPRPVALCSPVARQLRTTYSPPPSQDVRAPGRLRALVVGDPGEYPAQHLPGAREEALQVAEILEQRGVDVTLMVGPPPARGAARDPKLRGIASASRLEVLGLLMDGGWDILHYCGHGDFDPDDGTRAGWVFQGGLLTSRELERVEVAPRLVVANACLSGLTSQARGGEAGDLSPEARLLPSLADEFFRRGVRNYIGTAWEVNDLGAIEFARRLYDNLLAGHEAAQDVSLGNAILVARRTLANQEDRYGSLWAAYQHYGDPSFVLRYRA
jgi:pimeloyl-ACP methyl ester carboxylesterase